MANYVSNHLQEIKKLFAAGMTLQAIGTKYRVSRERIRQILFKVGVYGKHGGHFKRSQDAAKLAQFKYWNDELPRLGCNRTELLKITGSLRISVQGSPVNRFIAKRKWAMARGEAWELTFPQWRAVWAASGHWCASPRRQNKWIMVRHNKQVPWSQGNVRIETYSSMFKSTPHTWVTKKTHCIRGHEFAKTEVYHTTKQGYRHRSCRECGKIHSRASELRRQARSKGRKS
jgi:hypothetical protein